MATGLVAEFTPLKSARQHAIQLCLNSILIGVAALPVVDDRTLAGRVRQIMREWRNW